MPPRDRPLPISYSPGVREDILDLPTKEHRSLAILLIRDLVRGRERGEELGVFDEELKGCRKVYFSSAAEVRSGRGYRWRIVYRERPPSGRLNEPTIHIIAVGPRAHQQVYDTAIARLVAERVPEVERRQRIAEAAARRTSTAPAGPGEREARSEQTPARPPAERARQLRRRA
ncbi:hypothetical protein [Nonomuraea sp. NPDC049695]|uniref:hypothetical protein n=1 Tax=Nonomuraea sp. NPDC049695 TaxID=3154734 RepID=UPI003425EE19